MIILLNVPRYSKFLEKHNPRQNIFLVLSCVFAKSGYLSYIFQLFQRFFKTKFYFSFQNLFLMYKFDWEPVFFLLAYLLALDIKL